MINQTTYNEINNAIKKIDPLLQLDDFYINDETNDAINIINEKLSENKIEDANQLIKKLVFNLFFT